MYGLLSEIHYWIELNWIELDQIHNRKHDERPNQIKVRNRKALIVIISTRTYTKTSTGSPAPEVQNQKNMNMSKDNNQDMQQPRTGIRTRDRTMIKIIIKTRIKDHNIRVKYTDCNHHQYCVHTPQMSRMF